MLMHVWIIRLDQPGPVLEQRPAPEPGPDEVLVQVRATALNNADLAPAEPDQIPGYDFSGDVQAVGSNVDPVIVGTRVLGIAPSALADLVVAHRSHVIPIPDGLAYADAAALATASTTEYGALRRAGMQPGDTVLITAATSGIALIGAQIARELGAATVIGTTRSDAHRALIERVGVDHVLVTDADGLADAVRGVTGGAGADIVLDHVAGPMLGAAISAASIGGSVVSVGRLAGPSAELDLFALAQSGVTLRSVSFGFTPPAVLGDLLAGVTAHLSDAIAASRIAAVIGATVPFANAADAFTRFRAGVEGKVVVLHETAALER
jgi:NADPH:quinone reductase-like Zn-dependent oxidoreductase